MNVSRETFYLLLHMQGFRENVSMEIHLHSYLCHQMTDGDGY